MFCRSRRERPGEKSHSCEHCNKSFSTSFSLQHHIRVHTGEKPYSCSQCEKSFAQSSTLRRHQKVHTGEKPFTCSLCSKSFAESFNMKNHLIRVHSGEKPFYCSLCGRSFFFSGELKRHLKAHAKENSSSWFHLWGLTVNYLGDQLPFALLISQYFWKIVDIPNGQINIWLGSSLV